jgi:hypothetical protein
MARTNVLDLSTLKGLATLIQGYTYRKERDGETRVFFKDEFYEKDHALWSKIVQSQPDGVSMDFWHEVAEEVIDIMAEADRSTDEYAMRELVAEGIEPSIYTADLTNWLNGSNANVYYLTEAIQNYGVTDGFEALSMAQQLAKEGIANELINAMAEFLNSTESEGNNA